MVEDAWEAALERLNTAAKGNGIRLRDIVAPTYVHRLSVITVSCTNTPIGLRESLNEAPGGTRPRTRGGLAQVKLKRVCVR
jgi:hypothetical protein